MGMYDTINGLQVKCFWDPLYVNNHFDQSTGELRIFHTGDVVPYHTWWYDYTKDFDIIDNMRPKEDCVIVHKIRGGIVVGSIRNPKEIDFDTDVNLCVDYCGNVLNIYNRYDYQDYLKGIDKRRVENGLTKAEKMLFGNRSKPEYMIGQILHVIKESSEFILGENDMPESIKMEYAEDIQDCIGFYKLISALHPFAQALFSTNNNVRDDEIHQIIQTGKKIVNVEGEKWKSKKKALSL